MARCLRWAIRAPFHESIIEDNAGEAQSDYRQQEGYLSEDEDIQNFDISQWLRDPDCDPVPMELDNGDSALTEPKTEKIVSEVDNIGLRFGDVKLHPEGTPDDGNAQNSALPELSGHALMADAGGFRESGECSAIPKTENGSGDAESIALEGNRDLETVGKKEVEKENGDGGVSEAVKGGEILQETGPEKNGFIVEPAIDEDEDADDSSSSSSDSDSDSDSDESEESDGQKEEGGEGEKQKEAAEEELEEGEIRPARVAMVRKNNKVESFDDMLGSDDEEHMKGPSGLQDPAEVLPPVPPVDAVLLSEQKILPAGIVISVVGTSVVVEGTVSQNALNEGTILWATEKRLPLGIVDEVFGPVKSPFYHVRFNKASDVPDYVKEGIEVSFAPEFAKFVLNDPSLYQKGYDASGENDEELSDELEFSDDEKEAEYKRSKAMAKRGANARENNSRRKDTREHINHESVDKRKKNSESGKGILQKNNANRPREQGSSRQQQYSKGSDCWPPTAPKKTDNYRGTKSSPQHRSSPTHYQASYQAGGNFKCNHPVQQAGSSPHAHTTAAASSGFPSQSHNRKGTNMHPQMEPFSNQQRQEMQSASASSRAQSWNTERTSPAQPSTPSSMPSNMDMSPNFMDCMERSMQPAILGQPATSCNIQSNLPAGSWNAMQCNPTALGQPPTAFHVNQAPFQPGFAAVTWNPLQPASHVAVPQMSPLNANQGTMNPYFVNENTCVGIPVGPNPGFIGGIGAHNSMGVFTGQNVVSCPMPYGQFAPVLQGTPNQQIPGFAPASNMAAPQAPNIQMNFPNNPPHVDPTHQFQSPMPSPNAYGNNIGGNIPRPNNGNVGFQPNNQCQSSFRPHFQHSHRPRGAGRGYLRRR